MIGTAAYMLRFFKGEILSSRPKERNGLLSESPKGYVILKFDLLSRTKKKFKILRENVEKKLRKISEKFKENL